MTPRRCRLRPLALLAAAVLAACSPMPGTAAAAEEGEAPGEGVHALGRIEPHHGIVHVSAPSMFNAVNGAVLRKLLVEPGQQVKAGQVMAETDTAEVERGEVAIAKAQLELAERRQEQSQAEAEDVCSRAEVAQRTAARRSRLMKSGVASDEETDVATGDAKALSGSCTAARVAVKAAAAAVDVARAHVQRSEAELDRCFVRAPFDGLVLRTVHRPGEILGLDGVVELADVSHMVAVAEVYETDIRRVRKGQKATVTSPALAGPLSGKVETIRLKVRKNDVTGTDPAARKDARIVEVEVGLDDPTPVATLSNLQVEVHLHP